MLFSLRTPPTPGTPAGKAPEPRTGGLLFTARKATLRLAWLSLVACVTPAPLPPKALELNALGAEALQSGDLETAAARLNVALEYNPEFVDAITNLGLVELERGNFERAEQLLRRATRVNPDIAQPHHALGVLAERRGKGKDASLHYRNALQVDPGFAPARANYARLLLRSRLANDALLEFHKLIEVAPNSVAGYRGQIESLLLLERWIEADAALTRAEETFAEDPGLLLSRARWSALTGNLPQAEPLFEALFLRRDDFSIEAFGWSSLLALQAGNLERALQLARNGVALDPKRALPTYALALALDAKGAASASAWLERARLLDPENPVVLERLAARSRRVNCPGTGPDCN
jgi:tetratricopeptide (TPR) repeat protein